MAKLICGLEMSEFAFKSPFTLLCIFALNFYNSIEGYLLAPVVRAHKIL